MLNPSLKVLLIFNVADELFSSALTKTLMEDSDDNSKSALKCFTVQISNF